jgi:hypothetical protein
MNKIYAFIIIIPLIALLFIKSVTFYEFDTKQRYIKNLVDSTTHKVMITGVMTVSDKSKFLEELKKLGDFDDTSIILKYGKLQSDGSMSELYTYVPGNILDRGEIFSIYVQSKDESMLSRVEDLSADGSGKLFYKAKATCRIEKKQPVN